MAITAQKGAEIFNLSYKEFAFQVERNFENFFQKLKVIGLLRMEYLSFTILGCGSSGGVPRLGGNWGDCDPSNSKNQ